MTYDVSLATIESVANNLANRIVRTPTVKYVGSPIPGLDDGELYVKLELLQHAGSFKARGALNSIMNLDNPAAGVTAFSAGNHAIAVAFAAQQCGVSAKVVMPKTANPFRVERCQYWGAEIVLGETIGDLMSIVELHQRQEQRVLVHPFEGERTIQGAATVGLELCQDIPRLDAVVVPVGGGGLISGIASVVKQLQPDCLVIGVEPENAQGMASSRHAGEPLSSVSVNTIADSLGAPMHLPNSFALVQQHVDELVQVSDDQLRDAMRLMHKELKLAVEPACSAAMAALHGPLKNRLHAKRIAIIACGSNIDIQTYSQHVLS